jgi:hypothetical protein
MEKEPASITIIEGPPPDFKGAPENWTQSQLESARAYSVSRCQVRSFNGQALLDRCRRAWSEHNSIYLDFPTYSGLRRRLEIVAAQFEHLPEGDMLNLWVRHLPEQIQDAGPGQGSDELDEGAD